MFIEENANYAKCLGTREDRPKTQTHICLKRILTNVAQFSVYCKWGGVNTDIWNDYTILLCVKLIILLFKHILETHYDL